MTVLNTAWNGKTVTSLPAAETAPMFWDDRARSLETQAKGPATALDEMRGTGFDATTIFPEIVARLGTFPEYVAQFNVAFAADGITEDNVVRAIAAFERTLVDRDTSYDRYTHGDASALTAQQVRGLAVFKTTGCDGCHSGPMFSDFQLHRVAARGRGIARVADDGAGNGTFRTGSLRNVTRTAPYMHDGAFETLDQVFELYKDVDDTADAKLRALHVPEGADRAAVIAFLGALGDGDYDRTIPATVPSGLSVGGAIK